MSQALSAASPSWTKTLGTELKCAGAVIARREQQLLVVEPGHSPAPVRPRARSSLGTSASIGTGMINEGGICGRCNVGGADGTAQAQVFGLRPNTLNVQAALYVLSRLTQIESLNLLGRCCRNETGKRSKVDVEGRKRCHGKQGLRARSQRPNHSSDQVKEGDGT